MSEHERTGSRPQGFSLWLRKQILPGKPLRDVTRQIDIDWLFYCPTCMAPVLLVEVKHGRSEHQTTGNWAATRTLADRAKCASCLVIYHTLSGEPDSDAVTRFVVTTQLDGRLKTFEQTPEQFCKSILNTYAQHKCVLEYAA